MSGTVKALDEIIRVLKKTGYKKFVTVDEIFRDRVQKIALSYRRAHFVWNSFLIFNSASPKDPTA